MRINETSFVSCRHFGIQLWEHSYLYIIQVESLISINLFLKNVKFTLLLLSKIFLRIYNLLKCHKNNFFLEIFKFPRASALQLDIQFYKLLFITYLLSNITVIHEPTFRYVYLFAH